jgi:NAD(P)-dependent dehydrogenase (short-subunit alcohol dehydrogenase family)
MIYQVFKRFLDKSDRPVIVNISSGAGSMGMDLGASAPAYAVSKAALNMMVSYLHIRPLFTLTDTPYRPIN